MPEPLIIIITFFFIIIFWFRFILSIYQRRHYIVLTTASEWYRILCSDSLLINFDVNSHIKWIQFFFRIYKKNGIFCFTIKNNGKESPVLFFFAVDQWKLRKTLECARDCWAKNHMYYFFLH